MKKILFTLVALVASMSISAQVVKLYKGGNLVASFNKSQADEIVFEEAEGGNAVDLGLSVKWAECNLGANNPEDAGYYYAWGEAVPQANNVYSWSSYRWCQGTSKTMIKYCTDSSYGQVDNKKMLLSDDDAAQKNLPRGWRMPSKAEMQELIDKCAWKWTTKNGTPGYEVTASNGNSIFLPVTGTRYESSLNSADWLGSYWTSSLYEKWNDYANYLTFSENNHSVGTMFRSMGMAIRPVFVDYEDNGHEIVDLGLSVKWATCNIGASSPIDAGDGFTFWGDDDAAMANWGDAWRTPTQGEMEELLYACTWTKYMQNGQFKGYTVTGPNGNSIILPLVSHWTSTRTSEEYAVELYYDGFGKSFIINDMSTRSTHNSVRPVHP